MKMITQYIKDLSDAELGALDKMAEKLKLTREQTVEYLNKAQIYKGAEEILGSVVKPAA